MCGSHSCTFTNSWWLWQVVDPESGTLIRTKPRVERTRSLVTGGAGFVGSHLCDYLVQRGDHVRPHAVTDLLAVPLEGCEFGWLAVVSVPAGRTAAAIQLEMLPPCLTTVTSSYLPSCSSKQAHMCSLRCCSAQLNCCQQQRMRAVTSWHDAVRAATAKGRHFVCAGHMHGQLFHWHKGERGAPARQTQL